MKRCLIVALFTTLILILTACATKPQQHYFSCKQQNPAVVFDYFPLAFQNIGYDLLSNDSTNWTMEAIRNIKITNTKKGVLKESVIIRVVFNFKQNDTTNSTITQFYQTDINGTVKRKALTKQQEALYGKDATNLQTKTLFYCNPEFKGR